MPYVSEAQRRFFNANRGELEAQGVDVDEWNKATKGKKLPKRTSTKAKSKLQAGQPTTVLPTAEVLANYNNWRRQHE